MSSRRALHFVFKIGQRKESLHFYTDVLKMKCLRHEEFKEGCQASCNGPYDGKWSKSMVGYGPEDDHFVLELAYNYGIGSYRLGSDFKGITIASSDVYKSVKSSGWPLSEADDKRLLINAPDGYLFTVEDTSMDGCLIKRLSLASSDLQKTKEFWLGLCGMTLLSNQEDCFIAAFDTKQIELEFVDIRRPVDHGTACGRTAISCPGIQLAGIEQTAASKGHTILTPLISLDTPGKATVQVVILADPDGHEVCFVGDEAFRQLSQVDPEANGLLASAIADDKSDEWFAKKGKTKSEAASTTASTTN